MSRALLVVFLLQGCSESSRNVAPASPEAAPTAPAVVERDGAGRPPPAWVEARVQEARERLGETEAGRVLWASIEAHGGLQAWLGAGNISFEFDYRPLGRPERRMHSYQRVDLWSARAVHEELDGGAGEVARLGWDGTDAWITPNAEAFPAPARFWALTPYFFVAIPFVLADPGARFELLSDAALDGANHRLVKITYEDGTGDSPGDYYIAYINTETHRVAALRYIVAYPGFFPAGRHSPEKFMRYSESETVQGLIFATRNDTYVWDAGTEIIGDKVTEIEVSRLSLGAELGDDVFSAPEGAAPSVLEPQ